MQHAECRPFGLFNLAMGVRALLPNQAGRITIPFMTLALAPGNAAVEIPRKPRF